MYNKKDTAPVMLLEIIHNAFRDATEIVIGMFSNMVTAALSGMKNAVPGNHADLRSDTRNNTLQLRGRYVWNQNESKYVLVGDNTQQTTIDCEGLSYVHAYLAVSVEHPQELYATITRRPANKLEIEVVCKQVLQIQAEENVNNTEEHFNTTFHTIISNNSRVQGTLGTLVHDNGFERTPRSVMQTFPVPPNVDDSQKLVIMIPSVVGADNS
jgi:hypothetical protein